MKDWALSKMWEWGSKELQARRESNFELASYCEGASDAYKEVADRIDEMEKYYNEMKRKSILKLRKRFKN